MGDRVSISFKNGDDESETLFSHWGGQEFVEKAKAYARELTAERKANNQHGPPDRLEPNTVMVDFIRYVTKDKKRVESDLYLGKDETEGDNGDNGHYVIKLKVTP